MKIYIIGHVSPDLDTIASTVEYAEFLKKVKRYEGAQIIPARAGNPNKETEFVFSLVDIDMPKPLDEYEIEPIDAFILVDHNEESQRHPKVVDEQIIEIVDHHKINVNFNSPVRIDVKPVGCTGTVIYEHFEMYGIEPSHEIAQLMLAAILSDTVGLKSTTTTGTDSTVAHAIAQKHAINIEKLTFDIFKAKSDLSGLSAAEIVGKDYKVFDFGGKKVLISQVETVEPTKVLESKNDLIKALEEAKVTHSVSHAYLFITDILKLNSQAVYATEEEQKILEKAFTAIGEGNVMDVGPRISRKKDIAPAIELTLKN